MSDETTGRSLVQRARAEKAAYTQGEERPLGSFVGLMAAYTAIVGVSSGIVRLSGRTLPERIGPADLALLSVATHKLARLITKDPVTSPLRAPFTTFEGQQGEAEVAEDVRGTGPRKALGELLTCPFCVGQWVATGFAFSFVMSPRATRFAATILTAVTAADLMQFGYAKAEQASG